MYLFIYIKCIIIINLCSHYTNYAMMMIYIFIYFSGHVAFSPGIPQLHLKVLIPFIVKMDYTDDSLPHVSKHLGADHVWS